MVLEEKKPALTQRQREIYEFLKDKILNRGYGPTVREIGNHFGIRSPNGVMCHLKALEKKGLITRESHMSRAIQLSDPPQNRLSLPFAGELVDGQPLVSSDESQRMDFADMFDAEGNCCVRVSADYADAQINDGDCLVLNRDSQVSDGDIVVAVDDSDHATVCRYHREGSGLRLESLATPTVALNGRSRVVGVVVGVIRRFSPNLAPA